MFAGGPAAPIVNTDQIIDKFLSLISTIPSLVTLMYVCVNTQINTSYPIDHPVVNKVDPMSDTTVTTVNGLNIIIHLVYLLLIWMIL